MIHRLTRSLLAAGAAATAVAAASVALEAAGGRLCPARTSSGTAPVMRDPVTRHVECPAMLARG